MNRQRRLFLKRFARLLLFYGLLLSNPLILAGCNLVDDRPVVTAEPALDEYTPLLATPTAGPTEVRFAIIGDFGTGDDAERAVADLVKSWDVDFVATVGDNNYYNGKASTIDENIGQFYHEFIYPYKGDYGEGAQVNRFFPALGGHDWRQPGALPHLDYFTLPGNERYYDVRQGPVHLFILDSIDKEPDGVDQDSRQAQWFRGAIGASDAPWKLVLVHDPPYSSGKTHGSQARAQWPYREWGADAVIAGNDHDYERLLVGDLTYFVNGAGGARLYEFDDAEIIPGSIVRYNDDHGAMFVEAGAGRIVFRFVTVGGETVDEFVLE
jgi:hypothetical protein